MLDKGFNIAKIPKYDGFRHGCALVVYKFFDKNISGRGIKNKNIFNKELAEELRKQIIRKFNKRKVQSPFIGNIWGADLTDMQFIKQI